MIQSINLYTADMRPRHELLTLPRLALVALAALVLVVLAALYANWQAGQVTQARVAAQAKHDGTEAALAAATTRLEQRQEDPALRAELERLSLDLQALDALTARLESRTRLGAEGFSPVMEGLARQAVQGVWLTAFEIDREPGNLVLEGLTRDASLVPYYLSRLRSEEAFAGRRFRQFELEQVEDNAGVLAFRVASGIARQEPVQ